MKNIKLRFAVMSDLHVKDDPKCIENVRFAKSIDYAYDYARKQDYDKLDALYIVGDFADWGSMEQMKIVKNTLDEHVCKDETELALMLASHEYHCRQNEEEIAKERFAEVFNMPIHQHKVIKGYHFISVTCTRGCNFDEPEISFAAQNLKIAAEDTPKAPIFFFQHPHLSDTVYGSINWGDDALIPTLMNYPQVVDFSGHSHAPINDPRSIHQKHFTSLGTGSMSYTELDEFDKWYGTCPPDCHEFAQFLIVEVDEDNTVLVKSFDTISGRFFDCDREIPTCWDCSTYEYTSKRFADAETPEFGSDAKATAKYADGKITVEFPQALTKKERPDGYFVAVKGSDGIVKARKGIFSGYYLNDMPETLTVEFDDMKDDDYTVEITVEGFWKNVGDKCLTARVEK